MLSVFLDDLDNPQFRKLMEIGIGTIFAYLLMQCILSF